MSKPKADHWLAFIQDLQEIEQRAIRPSPATRSRRRWSVQAVSVEAIRRAEKLPCARSSAGAGNSGQAVGDFVGEIAGQNGRFGGNQGEWFPAISMT